MQEDLLSGNAESVFAKRLAAVFAFLVPTCAMLQLPGITFSVNSWNVHFFSAGSITFLALGTICCFPDRLKLLCRTLPQWIIGAFGSLIGISLWQIFRHWNNYLLADMGFTLMYAVLPLFGYVFRKELLRYLPLQFVIYWLLNITTTIVQHYCRDEYFYGIPSNINWNAAFTLLSGAAAIYYIYSAGRKKHKVIAGLGLAIVSVGSLWLIFATACRALIPGIGAAIIVAFLLYGKFVKWKQVSGLILLLGIIVGGILFFQLTRNAETRKRLLTNDRIFLAVTVPDMIKDAPLLGHGAPSFEQAFLPYYRKDAFFSLKYVPDRMNHPHNDILFVAAGYGLIGLLCVYGILFYAIFTAMRNYREEKIFTVRSYCIPLSSSSFTRKWTWCSFSCRLPFLL